MIVFIYIMEAPVMLAQQIDQRTATPTRFILYVTNFSHLPAQKQILLEKLLRLNFSRGVTRHTNMLRVDLSFQGSIHSGQFIRRLEMVISQLRTTIDPHLQFEQSFRYITH